MVKGNTGLTLKSEFNPFDGIEKIRSFVDNITTEEIINETDDNGNVTKSETVYKAIGNVTYSSKEEIIQTIVLGHEMGLNPMTSIQLGRLLNKDALYAVMAGRSMGIDPMTSIRNIYPIPNGKGGISFKVGVHIMEAQLAKANVTIEILEDFKPNLYYRNIYGQIFLEHEISNDNFIKVPDKELNRIKFILLTESNNPKYNEAVKKYIADGFLSNDGKFINEDYYNKIAVALQITSPCDRITTIRMTREKPKMSITKSYTLQQATDANLYNGFHSMTGAKVEGKSNWNLHPQTMLTNFLISTIGAIIAGDYLYDMYNESQTASFEDNVEVEVSQSNN